MVLRRTLPSRLTGAPAPAAAPMASAPAEIENTTAAAPTPASATASTVASSQAAALAAATAAVFAAPPVAALPAAPITPRVIPPRVDDDFTAMPTSNAPRVLEDSFMAVAAAPVVATSLTPAAPVAVAVPAVVVAAPAEIAAPVLSVAPAPVEATPAHGPAALAEPSAPVEQAAQTEPAAPAPALTTPPPTDFLADNPFMADTSAAPLTEKVVSRPPEGGLRRRVAQVQSARPSSLPTPRALPVMPRPATPVVMPVALAPAATPAATIAESILPVTMVTMVTEAAPVVLAPTPPPAALTKAPRKALPRDFAAATIAAATPTEATAAAAPALTLAPEIPVDTRPLDRVNEELIASGIIAGPAGDSLTNALPGSMAVAESAMPASFGAATFGAGFATGLTSLPEAPLQDYSLATGAITAPPAPPSSGMLPWQAEPTTAGWQLEANTTPPPDVFKPQTTAAEPATGPRMPPPVLPATRPSRAALAATGHRGNSWMGMGLTAVALGGIGLYVWNQASQPGGLESVKAQMAKLTEPGNSLALPNNNPMTDPALLAPPRLVGQNDSLTGNTQIAFAPPAPDPNAPLVATPNDTMPADVSLFAQFQQAIQAERAKKGEATTDAAGTPIADLPTTTADAPLTKAQVEAELAAYQRALVDNPNNPPRPREFMRDPDAYMDGRNAADTVATNADGDAGSLPDGTLLPPPAGRNARADRGLPLPEELYANNPNGLPIVAEPINNQAPRVRQLEDFAAELMAPEDRKVKIPQGMRPRLAATDFPTLEVLSFVPGRGVVATTDGREGVLLIGETLNGWELTNVTNELAEFKTGGKSYYVTAQN